MLKSTVCLWVAALAASRERARTPSQTPPTGARDLHETSTPPHLQPSTLPTPPPPCAGDWGLEVLLTQVAAINALVRPTNCMMLLLVIGW